jgi:hypothetical protein
MVSSAQVVHLVIVVLASPVKSKQLIYPIIIPRGPLDMDVILCLEHRA